MRPTALLLAVILFGITASARHRRVHDLLGRLLGRPAKGAEHFARAAAWTPPGEAARNLGTGPAGRARLGLEVIAGTYGGTAFATLTDVPALVLGPPGSGKSSAVFIPAVLEWAGSAVVTSTSRDILIRTIRHRAQLGPVVVFGPAMRLSEDLQGLLRPWTPLVGCLDRTGQPSWAATWRTAHTMVSAAQDHSPGDGQFWSMKAAELLALAMWTVAVEDAAARAIPSTAARPGTMREVLKLVAELQSGEGADALRDRVRATGHDLAALVSEAALGLPPQTLGGMVATAMACLSAYLTTAVADAPMQQCLRPAQLLTDRMTLYVLGAAPVQQLYRPIYTALLAWLLHEAEDYADATPDGRLPVPLLLAIDEAGTIAPLPDLARITATVRKAGIRLITAWHDLSQLEARYGTAEAGTILSGAGSVLVLPGLTDQRTTDWVERAFGLREVLDESTSQSTTKTQGHGDDTSSTQRSTSRSITRLPLVPAGAVPTMPPGSILALIGPHRLTLEQRRWYQTPELMARARDEVG